MKLWVIRAKFGTYTRQFVEGGYVAIDYGITTDLATVATKDQLVEIYRNAHRDETSSIVIGQQVGQIVRFLLEMQPDDYVITPSEDTEWSTLSTAVAALRDTAVGVNNVLRSKARSTVTYTK